MTERTGVAPSALRFYERRGLVRPVGREGGKRVYDDDVIEQLALIDLLQQSGLTIAEIAAIVDPDGHVDASWRAVAGTRLAALRVQLDVVQRAVVLLEHTLKCRHASLDTCPLFREAVRGHARTLATAGATVSRRAGRTAPRP